MVKMGRTIEFETVTRDLSFSNEMIQKGSFNNVAFEKEEEITHDFIHSLDILSDNLLNKIERKVCFHFKLKIEPNVAVIDFDGDLILESEQQRKIDKLIKKRADFLKNFLNNFILKNSYYHAEKIANLNAIPFPQADLILKSLGIS